MALLKPLSINVWLYSSVLLLVQLAEADYRCGSVVNNELKSPGYPSNYPNSIHCVYRVPIPYDRKLDIYFSDFHLESHSFCGYDYLQIADENNHTIGKYCGLQSGKRAHVTGQYAFITFHTDGSVQYRGYKLMFSHVPNNCSTTLNTTYGEISFNVTSSFYDTCYWIIQSAGVSQAVALISVQKLNLQDCSEYATITDGNGSGVLYHRGCVPFATENLLDVQFGMSKNISVTTNLGSSRSSIRIKFAIFRRGLSSAILVSGWNATILNAASTSLTLQWTDLRSNINRVARFYIILIKSIQGLLLSTETVSGGTSTVTIRGLRPSTQYRIDVYGIDDDGQAYKSEENLTSTANVSCGYRPSGSRIVGGSAARVNSWPWQAMLLYTSGSQFCGGSLIDTSWVVTAAHCVNGRSPSSIKVTMGAHYRTSGSVGTEQEIGVEEIIVHERYNYPLSYSNDIALIKLVKPADLGVGVGLVCLPDVIHPLPFDNPNKKCWITGWGRLSSGGSQPNTLMEAQVPLVSKQRCQSAYPGQIGNTMLCAGLDEGGVDTCQGDSGGPLVCEFNGTWYLEGITSWGYRCAYARKYGIYSYVRNLKAWVSRNIYHVAPPIPPPQNQSESALVWCSFNNGLCPGWNQSSSDDFDWTLASGSTPSSSTGPSSGQGGSGNYMYIETSSPRKPGENAKLVVTVPNNGKDACLSFYYHMYGDTVGTLNVYSGNNKVFNVSGNQSNSWEIIERNVRLESTVTFEGITGNSFTGDIAIDSVKITEGSCPVNCSFDNGLCPGWTQSQSDDFDWILHSGPTPTWSTGPSSGHGGSGKYMYIDASYGSTGYNAKLQFAVPRNKSTCCLVFYYHMYGSAMGTLHVYNGNDKVFSKSGSQGNYWKKVRRTLYSPDIVTFEGIRGSSITSDIAIDDVSVTDGECPGCGGVLNQSSGQLSVGNDGDEGELHCNWTLGNAGVKQAAALITLERIYMSYCSEHFKILKSDGSQVFSQGGCRSSLPYGTVLEVPFGAANYLLLDILLEYRWSAVNIKYITLKDGLNSAGTVSSWNTTVSYLTSSSARVYWSNFPLSPFVSYYLVRYKEVSNGFSRLFQVSRYSNTHYTSLLKAYTAYDIQVFAVTKSIGNVTYASKTVSIQTQEGVPSRAPTNVQVENHGLNELLVKWDSIPQKFVNGRLQGYKVFYKNTRYYYNPEIIVTTNNSDITQVILPNIQTGERYQISAVGFTPRGQGPRSSYLYVTKGCQGSVNQSNGWLNFTQNDYNVRNCSIQINNAGASHGVVLVSFHYISLGYCSEFIRIHYADGTELFSRRGCDSLPQGLTVEIPFGGDNIILAVLLSYRYSSARIQYTVLGKSLSSAQVVPSWNITFTSQTSSSLSIRWPNFPLNVPLQRFLVKYTEQNSNVSLVFQVSRWYTTHYTGRILKGFELYEVKVIAVTTNVGNGTYATEAAFTRTDQGVPSIAPSNVRVFNLQLGELKVRWDPIPPQAANGRLLGYRVSYMESYWIKYVNTTNLNTYMVVLRGLKLTQGYRISVAAFTSKGVGPQSPWIYITTGCGGYVNQLFGQLQIGSNRAYSYVGCTLLIGKVGISQASALVWIREMYLPYYGEYVKIIDGNGSHVIYGYSSSTRNTFLEVKYGPSDNITVQINLRSSNSRFNLQYGIVKHGIRSALPLENWNVTVGNISTTGIGIHWPNLAPLINGSVLYYITLISHTNGSLPNVVNVEANTTFANFRGLSPYTDYLVNVVAVSSNGRIYRSSNVTVQTDEGVPSRAPSNVQLSNLQSSEVKVQWDPLPQQYANGRLLGYRVYFNEYPYYSYLEEAVNTSGANVHIMILRELKAAQRYRIRVAAFTSKGVGPLSYYLYITTACGGSLNRPYGEVHVARGRFYSSLRCKWTIGNMGISQAVALVSLQELQLSCNEYVRVIDGNGLIVLSHSGYSSTPQKPFLEVRFAKSGNITVESYVTGSYSSFKLKFGILQHGLHSVLQVANWSASVENATTTSLAISWQNLALLMRQRVLHYFVLIKSKSGGVMNGNIVSENTNFDVIRGLSTYTEYQISIVGVGKNGTAYTGNELTAWTDEGVPSRAPSNIRLTNLRSAEVKVQWDPLPQQYANGRILGYRIYYYEYSSYLQKTVNTSIPDVNMVTLIGLMSGQRYYITVAAFTSKGTGPRSYQISITTGCGGSLNQTFGQLQVGRQRYSNYLRCTWAIRNVGISQAVALVSLQELYLSYYYEYVKVIDGNGVIVFNRYGYSSAPQIPYLEVLFGNSGNITVQIYLSSSYSIFKLRFGILKQGLQSALPLSNWSVLIGNTTTASIRISWQNLTPLLGRRIPHYVVVIKSINGSILNGNIVPEDTTSDAFYGLSPFTEYQLSVVGADDQGIAYKSNEVSGWTDEGVPSRAPSNITFSDISSTQITVNWKSLPQQYHNGRLLGYKVYFRKTAYFSIPGFNNASRLNVSNPNSTRVTLTELSPGQRYDIYVSAYTSKGEGPHSSRYYVKTACKMSVNQSFGLIDVLQTAYDPLFCDWTIGNIGITRAIGLFLIQKMTFSYCSEYLKIYEGSGSLKYHKSGCSSSDGVLLVEVPFLSSSNITASIYLYRLKSAVRVQYVVLRTDLNTAPLLTGWRVTVANTTSSSISVQWTNLTSLVNRQARNFIVLLNSNNGSALANKITHGNQLTTEITGLEHSTNYTLILVGVDEQGQPYKSLAVNATTEETSCGSRPSSARIVGGTVAAVNSWPWQAMLREPSGRQFCGGSLIHPQWVLTATHCVRGKSPSSVKVRLGAHYRLSASIGTEQDFDVIRIIEHERYYSPNRWSNDVALLMLSRPAQLGRGVGLVCLSDSKYQLPFDDASKKCWITGWGTLYYLGPQPSELMQVDLPLVSKPRCMNLYPNSIDDSMICVGSDQGGVGACHGDSGGPLVCEFNDKWYLEGVTSWGGLPCAARSKPTVYADVRHLKPWIASKISQVPSPPVYTTPRPYTTYQPYTTPQPGCGSIVSNSLKSPGYPSNYPNNIYCVYQVPIPYGMAMNIYFSDFYLEGGSCSYDYLRIANHYQTIGTYCGQRSGLNVRVTGNYAVITFRSDGSVRYRGYQLYFSYVPHWNSTSVPSSSTSRPYTTTQTGSPQSSCNFDYGLCSGWRQSYSDVFDWTRNSGSTSSSGTGPSSDHTTGSGYYMYIEASSPRQRGDNAKLELSVSGSGEVACLKFYYHMYGATMGSLMVYSGYSVVFNVSGNQGSLWRQAARNIYLRSNVTFEGIVGSSYEGDVAIDDVTITSGSCPVYSTAPPYTTPQPSCGSVVSNSLKSPGYPSNYPNNMYCTYQVLIPYGLAMNIYFSDFYLEGGSCSFDYLRIDSYNRTIGTYCGQRSGLSIRVTGNYAALTFRSDGSGRYRGYHLYFSYVPLGNSTAPPYTTNRPYTTHQPYTTPRPGCGYVISNALKSPGYPTNYPNNMNCVYQVPIPYGRAMIIYFYDFYLENASNCRYDYLRISNYNHTIGTYCGQRSGLIVRVTGNYVVITFRSDSIVQKRGYQLYFSFVPLGNSTAPPYSTHRPNRTHRPYTTSRPYTTTRPGNFTAPPYSTHRPRTTHRPNTTSRPYTTYQPYTTPRPGCGHVKSNSLKSPGYPRNYPNNMNCVYRVFIPYGRAMIIYFNDFYLENASNCRYDYLRIANPNHTIGTYCGQQSGLNVRVTGNYAVITFRSDNVIQKRGFQLYFSYFPLENSTGPPYATNRPHTTHRSYTTHRPRTNPPPGCSDKGGSNFCAGIAHGNFCMVYLNFTQEFCAKTCGFCEVPCVDAIVCPPLSQSFCLSNHNWSMQNCRKSCGFCTASTSGPGTSPPITSQQHTSQPDYSEHSTSQPSITQASSSNPGTSQSSTSQPSTSQPSTSQPGTSQPGSSQPGTSQQHTPQPSTFQPDSSQPSSSQPSTSQSNTSQASTSQSSTSQSGNSQPGSSQPGNSQPNTPQPGTSQPSTFQPVTSKPRTSQPDSSQTSTFQPSTSQRGTSQLATSQPESSQPGSSQASPSQKGTSQPGTYATTRPTPSDEEEQESVMLKVRGLQIKKWDNEMENTFKTEVARAATEYCATDGAQCQLSSKSSRKRRSSDITFSDNMVHILPGYPTQSPDDPDVALLAFYLSIRQGLINNTVVNKDVLKDIVNEDISTIGRSMGGTIVSVEPLPSTTEKLQDTNEDEENDGNSKATNVIIGASVGGVLFFVIIVAAFVSCKRSNRGARIRHVESQDTLDRNTINARATNESSGENGDHVRVVEHIVEIEGIEAPCSSREQPNEQPQKNATKTTQSEPCQTDIAYPSVVQVQRESPDKLERLKCNELENVKERKEAKPLSNVGNKTDGSKEKAALKSYSDVHNGEQVQQAKENSDRHLPNEEDQHQDSRL